MPKAIALYMGQPRKPGGCEIYRINMPFSYLDGQQGWKCYWDYFDTVINIGRQKGPGWWGWFVDYYDVFVFPRFFVPDGAHKQPILDLFNMLREYGKVVIYEVDDDYTNEHREVINGDALGPASMSDAVTVTTPLLATRMTNRTGRPCHILPNMLDPKLWFKPSKERWFGDELIIGLSGSATHHKDWAVLQYVLPKLLSEYSGTVKLAMTAFHPEYLKDLPNTLYLPGADYHVYAEIVKNCDIILAPVLPDDGFNLSKSEIKTTEGQGAHRYIGTQDAGAAVIATDNAVYRLGVQHEHTGLLTEHTPDGWYNAIKRLIEDVPLRKSLQINGFKWVKRHRNIKTGWTLWRDVYASILRNKSPERKANFHVSSRTERHFQYRAASS